MDDLVAQGLGHGEGSSIDHGSRGSGDDGADMAGNAADSLEQLLPRWRGRRCSQRRVPWRSFRAADELSKVVDVCQADIVGNIFGIAGSFANSCDVLWTQTVRYSHFVQVSVPNERKQTAVLILPAKAANARLPGRFQDRNFDCFAVNSALTHVYLMRSEEHTSELQSRLHLVCRLLLEKKN